MKDFNDIKVLRFWCQKVLPLVYDDSLSYYELLCKVVAKLNEVIERVDEIPDYIKQLISEDYLKPILAEVLDELREQIAQINEHDSKTATADRHKGELVWLENKLYRVTRDMFAGDQYFLGSNIEKVDIEWLIKNTYDSNNNTLNIHGVTIGSGTDDEVSAINLDGKILDLRDLLAQSRIDDVIADLNTEIIDRQNGDNALGARVDGVENDIAQEIVDRENADRFIDGKVNQLNYDPINVLTLGMDNTGATDCTALFNQWTQTHNLFFPAGEYLFNGELKPVHSVFGVGAVPGAEAQDKWSHIRYRGGGNYAVVVEGNQAIDFVFSGLYIDCNGTSGGIFFNPTNYLVCRIKECVIESVKGIGINVDPKSIMSRCMIIEDCQVFGVGQVATIGYQFTNHATDCRMRHCYAGQIQIGLKTWNNLLFLENCHFWSGIIVGPLVDSWYVDTKGIWTNNSIIQATNLYLDTHHLCFYDSNSSGAKSQIHIDNLTVWYDDSIASTVYKDGSLTYGDFDVYVNGGVIYPRDYLPNIANPNIQHMENVIIKSDNFIYEDKYFNMPIIPVWNDMYVVNHNDPDRKACVEVAYGVLPQWGSISYDISDNLGNHIELTVTRSDVTGDNIGATWMYKAGNPGTIDFRVRPFEYIDPVSQVKTLAFRLFRYHGLTNIPLQHRIYCKCSEYAYTLNYNCIVKEDGTPYSLIERDIGDDLVIATRYYDVPPTPTV